ncbi:MAG: glycerol-3-phosphate acyltransferase PlsX [Candidatus Endobugula sp.]|jgi:glycerol-3-phosphate acyltransferase PlsX
MSTLSIAVDIMGGDIGVEATIPAVLKLAKRYENIQFQLYGESAVNSVEQLNTSTFPSNIVFVETAVSVNMDDSPMYALRHKRDSSMAKALAAVAEGKADGCISAGNTGALVAMGMHFLKTYTGVHRPALCQAVPTAGTQTDNRHSYLLDLGANVDCSAEQLQQFACLGSALCSVLDGRSSPTVRLLNVGGESFKGSAIVQEAAELLQQSSQLNYQGFVEGDDIYQGVVDVIVCDGFVGNIALKTSEGVARFVTDSLKKTFQRSLLSQFIALFSAPLLRSWRASMNPDRYNGAYLLGLQGTVVKSHGSANASQFSYALEMLIHQLQKQHSCSMEASLKRLSL